MAALMLQTIFGSEEDLKAKCMVGSEVSFESLFDNMDEKDDNKRCFVKCVFVKYGAMTENGDLLLEEIKKTVDVPDELLAALKQNCASYNKKDLCTGAKEFIGCSIKYAEEMMGM